MTTDTSAAHVTMEHITDKNVKSNMVAECDLQGALKGIENRLEQIKDEAIKKSTKAESPGTGVDENGDETQEIHSELYSSTFDELLSEAVLSLTEHVQRIVQPVTDDEYFAHMQRSYNDQDTEDDEESQPSQEEVNDLWPEEYDEEELLDQDAMNRAKELREQVRETAERVKATRDDVTKRTLAIAKGEVELLVGPQSENDETPFDPEQFESKFRQLEAASAASKNAKLQEMEKSIDALMSSLRAVDCNLPESIDNLQETVQTIEESIARRRGGVENLSQTEQAIVSRENEGASYNSASKEDNPSEPVAPEKQLASFLGRH